MKSDRRVSPLFTGAVLLAAVFSSTAGAQSESALPDSVELGTRWFYVGETDFSRFYLDTSRISPADDARADIWVHQILHIRSAQRGAWLDRSVDHLRVNCRTPAVEGTYSTTWYDGKTFVKTLGDGTLRALPAGTNSSETAAALCRAIGRATGER